MKEIIKLRGHHIDVLAERMAKIKLAYEPVSHFYSKKNEFMPKMPRFNIEDALYTSATQLQHNAFWELIMQNPDLPVQIVKGLDSVCATCNNHPDSLEEKKVDSLMCANAEDRSDIEAIKQFGLVVGETYTVQELIGKIKDFQQRTGKISPRQDSKPYFLNMQ